MSDPPSKCSCVVDCSGLYEIAKTESDNLKPLYLDRLQQGVIGVPTCVWQEFQELYENEAAELEAYVGRKITLKKSYHSGVASIADGMNPRFSRGPYDRHTDLYAASICWIEGYTLLTTSDQLRSYKEMKRCQAMDLATWAEGEQ